MGSALVVMGSASAAGAVSVGLMATLFGTAGAGLAGYKMLKRTRGDSAILFLFVIDLSHIADIQ